MSRVGPICRCSVDLSSQIPNWKLGFLVFCIKFLKTYSEIPSTFLECYQLPQSSMKALVALKLGTESFKGEGPLLRILRSTRCILLQNQCPRS